MEGGLEATVQDLCAACASSAPPRPPPSTEAAAAAHPRTGYLASADARSERPEVLDEVDLLGRRQSQPEERVIVVDHRLERREPTVMEEPALRVREKSLERRRSVAVVGRAVRLEVVDPDL